MRILLNIHHTPWEHMFASVFGDAEIHALDWNTIFRDVPENVKVVTQEQAASTGYDAVVYDNFAVDRSVYGLSKTVFIVHCEQDLNSHENVAWVQKVYLLSDFVVAVTPHKMATLRQFAKNRKTVCQRHAMLDAPVSEILTSRVGTVHNSMSREHLEIWNPIASSYPESLAIGHNNNGAFGELVSPHGSDAYNSALSRIGVFVNVVGGDAFGMSPMEAMARGIPIVTGLNRDLPDQFISGYNCLISGQRGHHQPAEMNALVRMLTEDDAFRKRIGMAGLETAKEVFSVQAFRNTFEVLFS